MTTITISFRAKKILRTNWDKEGLPEEYGYRIPTLGHQHVSFSDRSTLAVTLEGGLNKTELTWPRLNTYAGMPTQYVVFEDDPNWTIEPIGNGFMADVSITRELKRR